MADLTKLLWPKSIALIGASSDTQGLRGRILEIMKGHPFAGKIHPVSRSASEVQGLKAYASVAELPEPADLALLIIPAKFVPEELERCAKAGIKAAYILSSGFAEEPGASGVRLQDEIVAIARRHAMVVVGPNAEGFANLAANLCATFSPAVEASARPLLPPGARRAEVAVVAQSGGMGFAFFDRGRPKNLAFRYIVTTGNEACVDVCDFLDAMLDEGKTDVFLLLVEDIKSPDEFRRVAAKALRAGKPLIVGKIGQSEAGSRAAASHTGALAGSAAAYRAVFERYGVIEGRDLDDMVDLAMAFTTCVKLLPAGKRVGICTSSGGGGVWVADACAAAGLSVPPLDAATRAAIDVHLPPYGTSQNPVDVTAQGVHHVGYAEFARLLDHSPEVDGIIMVITARATRFIEGDRARLEKFAGEATKPVLLWSYTLPTERNAEILSSAGYPLFTSLQNCARAMAQMADYRAARERHLAATEVRPTAPAVRAAAQSALGAGGAILCEWEARRALAGYGIGDGNAGKLVRSAEEAEAAARALGGPVALKVQSPDIPHKTEAGAVLLDIATPAEARAGYARVLAAAQRHAPAAHILGVLVQPMAPPGREVILGISNDAQWGPMLMVGLGGVLVEALGDTALAPVPLDHDQARALIARLEGARLLEAFRGAAAADVDALADLMVNLARFAHDHAETIAEIDLNPVLVHPRGVSVVDALIVRREAGAPADKVAIGE
ncbi:MAG TPA: acetate--CoA ligase family protein [Xanthobacteraceae bacterium]|nr:acetate--CoA ligase family protein [Xanthobacteraceae bacterium]